MEAEPQFVADTLAWCNERRKEKGMEPLVELPKGRKLQGDSCPCGKATGLHVGKYGYKDINTCWRTTVPLPESVQQFVITFDGGGLPQYDIDYFKYE